MTAGFCNTGVQLRGGPVMYFHVLFSLTHTKTSQLKQERNWKPQCHCEFQIAIYAV